MKHVTKREMEFTIREVTAGLEALEKKEDLKQLLMSKGYRQEDFDRIAELCRQTVELYERKEAKTRLKLSQSREFEEKMGLLRREVYFIAIPFRRLFRKDEVQREYLGLKARRTPRRQGAYIEWAKDFLSKINNDEYIRRTPGCGINQQKLDEVYQMVIDIEAFNDDRQLCNGEKKAAVKERNKAHSELATFWSILKDRLGAAACCRRVGVDKAYGRNI